MQMKRKTQSYQIENQRTATSVTSRFRQSTANFAAKKQKNAQTTRLVKLSVGLSSKKSPGPGGKAIGGRGARQNSQGTETSKSWEHSQGKGKTRLEGGEQGSPHRGGKKRKEEKRHNLRGGSKAALTEGQEKNNEDDDGPS